MYENFTVVYFCEIGDVKKKILPETVDRNIFLQFLGLRFYTVVDPTWKDIIRIRNLFKVILDLGTFKVILDLDLDSEQKTKFFLIKIGVKPKFVKEV